MVPIWHFLLFHGLVKEPVALTAAKDADGIVVIAKPDGPKAKGKGANEEVAGGKKGKGEKNGMQEYNRDTCQLCRRRGQIVCCGLCKASFCDPREEACDKGPGLEPLEVCCACMARFLGKEARKPVDLPAQ